MIFFTRKFRTSEPSVDPANAIAMNAGEGTEVSHREHGDFARRSAA